jgi:hypothetical protein
VTRRRTDVDPPTLRRARPAGKVSDLGEHAREALGTIFAESSRFLPVVQARDDAPSEEVRVQSASYGVHFRRTGVESETRTYSVGGAMRLRLEMRAGRVLRAEISVRDADLNERTVELTGGQWRALRKFLSDVE